MEHLALEIFDKTGGGSKFANLDDSASITITITSNIFDSGDIWSHNFSLNIPANAHIFGSAGEMHGSRLHEQLEKRMARLWVMGIPMYMGYLRLGDQVDVDENGDVDVSFESGQKTFKDMIDGAKANQVPPMTDVLIGMALWRKRYINWPLRLKAYGYIYGKQVGSGKANINDPIWAQRPVNITADGDVNPTQNYPRMVYPKGRFYNEQTGSAEEINVLNTDHPYDINHPFCNIALCYQKYGFPEKDEGGKDFSAAPVAERGYEVMPPNRVNSAPNFYVIYWLHSLMKHLNIHVDENQMESVEDLRRLFFVNTKCAYEEIDKLRYIEEPSERYGRYQFIDRYLSEKTKPRGLIKMDDCSFTATNLRIIAKGGTYMTPPDLDKVIIKVDSAPDWTDDLIRRYKAMNGYLHKAYATGECFPDEDIETTIEMLENAFGVRLLFDQNYKRVRIVLLRNLFASKEVQEIKCDTIQTTKTENNIRGFRLTYAAGTENTAFYYKGFADKLQHAKELWEETTDTHDYSVWDVNAVYRDVIQSVSAFNKTCYVVPSTGNAYGVKVDKDAKRYEDLHPSLFEFAGYMDAEDGDCSGGEETIKEISVGFVPAIMNDVNIEEQRSYGSTNQRFALFVDEQMRPRRYDPHNLTPPASYNDSDAVYDVDKLHEGNEQLQEDGVVQYGMFAITSDSFNTVENLIAQIRGKDNYPIQGDLWWDVLFDMEGHVNEGYRLYLQDNYEPNDEGVSPIEKHEWGLTLGIMRGSGSDAYVAYGEDPEDGEGNDTWDVEPGSSASAHPDVCDDYGKIFDYNGAGTVVTTSADAIRYMQQSWTNSNINLIYHNGNIRTASTFISGLETSLIEGPDGKLVKIMIALTLGENGDIDLLVRDGHHISSADYVSSFRGMTAQQMYAYDADRQHGGLGVLIEVGSSSERLDTLFLLQERAFTDKQMDPIYIDDNGVGTMFGRFSLKLRAEKPNPFFDPSQPESEQNRRYLPINNTNLRNRGLSDQFYKAYSYWIRNARIANKKVNIGPAELISIDTSVRSRIDDITGFIKKIKVTVKKKTGLEPADIELWYL